MNRRTKNTLFDYPFASVQVKNVLNKRNLRLFNTRVFPHMAVPSPDPLTPPCSADRYAFHSILVRVAFDNDSHIAEGPGGAPRYSVPIENKNLVVEIGCRILSF